MTSLATRTDSHRPSVITMADYEWLETYTFKYIDEGDGIFVPLDPEGAAFFSGLREDSSVHFADTHGNNKDETCDVCGARFVYGVLFTHLPTGDIVKTGQDCAATVCEGINAKLSEFEKRTAAAAAKARRGAKAKRIRRERWAKLRVFLSEMKTLHPTLTEALRVDHYIIRDLRTNLIQWGKMSEKQIELAFKIGEQKAEQDAGPPPVAIPVSDKRVKILGTILGTKVKEGYMGEPSLKMLLEVPCGDGVYKLWGTVPSAILDLERQLDNREWDAWIEAREEAAKAGDPDPEQNFTTFEFKGITIEFMCRVSVSDDDPSFGFISRPTKIVVID